MILKMASRTSHMANSLLRGFTVVELTLYMGLLAIFLAVLSQLFVSSLSIQLESESASSVQLDGSYLLSRLTYDIMRADQITIPAVVGETSERLRFVLDGSVIEYTLSGSNIILTKGGSTNRLNSAQTNVSDLMFERGGNISGKTTITVTFTLTSVIAEKGGRETKNYQTTIGTR